MNPRKLRYKACNSNNGELRDDLSYLHERFHLDPLQVVKHGSEYYLKCNAFDEMTDLDAYSQVNEIIKKINGFTSLRNIDFRAVETAGGVARFYSGNKDLHFFALINEEIAGTVVPTFTFSRWLKNSPSEIPLEITDLYFFIKCATNDRNVGEALTHYRDTASDWC